MAPTGLVLDVWSDYSDQETIMLDILLPNGIFLKMEASKEATLEELKMEVWVAAQQCPLHGQLHEPESYVFVCVNACTAEREVQVEERRTLSETRPFQAILQLVERKVDNAQKRLNSQIRFLIGKGLREFDSQNPEVSAFRKRMRYFCETSRKNQSQTWQQRLLCQHPAQIESEPDLPRYLLDKLHDENLVLSIHLEHSGSESTFKFSVSPSLDATGLLQTILSKKSHSTGLDQNNLCNFLFKVCGLEEYITGTHPLSRYKYIREMISREKVPELLLISMDKVELEEELVYEYLEKLPLGRPRMYSVVLEPALSANRKKQPQLPTWTVEEPFVLSVHFVHRLYCENKSRVALKLCLYHGDERLSKVVHTSDQPIEEGQGSWEEEVKFDLSVSNIPRMARLCLSLYEVSRTVKSNRSRKCLEHKQDVYANPIAWINTTLFDFNGVLKSGPIKLYLWCYGDDIDPDVMLNPLGGAVPNPNYDQCAVLTVSFRKYHQFSDLVYPSLDKILENAAILQNENNSSSSCLEPQASKSHLEQLRQICDRDSLYQLHEQEKELLWFLRRQCLAQIPHSLPKLLRSVKWNDRRDIAQMTSLLQTWPRIAPVRALELLDYAFPCPTVRSFAVQCLRDLSDEDLSLYLLQLVRALKHESYFYCDLVQFLLERALAHRHLGHKLFWLLRSEMKFDDVSLRFGLILEAYCRGALKHLPALTKQVEALNKLKVANELVQNEGNKRKDGREKLKSLIQETLSQNSYKNSFIDLQNPLDPRYKLGRLKVEKCKFLDSKMKPLWLTFENSDTFGKDVFIIFKNGDDLRQDMLTLQMIRIMDKMWKDEGLDLRMIPYQCLATDYKMGLIEVVPEADTIANIQKEKGFTPTSAFKKGSILAWLKDHNPDDKSLSKAAEEFTLSCAGYCVATYVLGVADRHSDNIMVKTNGQLFHIDFGHILGKFKEKFGIKRERVPFVLTHDFVYIITKGHTQKSEEFSRFQQYCEQAFTILRRKGPIVVSLFAMMLSTGMPELNCERDLDYLRETLVLDMSEQEALRHFRSKFDDALRSSWKTSVNWMAHNWAKDNKMVD